MTTCPGCTHKTICERQGCAHPDAVDTRHVREMASYLEARSWTVTMWERRRVAAMMRRMARLIDRLRA